MRDRHLHQPSDRGPRRRVAGDRLLRGGDERSGPAARLPRPGPVRDRRSRRRVVPAGRRLSQRQRRRPGVRAARVRDLRRPVRRPPAPAAARAAHADRHHPAHHPRPAEPAAAPRHRRDRRDVAAPGGDEPPRRHHPGRRLRHRAGSHRRHSARHPGRPGQAGEQAPPRRRRTDGPADVRPALAGQGHRVRHRRAAGDRGELSVGGLHRARRHPSARQGWPGRGLSADARGAGATARRRRARDVPRPLRRTGRAERVPRRRRHLRHALPEPGAEHLGDAGLRRRLGPRRHLDAVRLRPRAAGRGPRRAGAVPRRRGDRPRGSRAAG